MQNKPPHKLSARHSKFCELIAEKRFTNTQAYVLAGYDPSPGNAASASRLLAKPEVQDRIQWCLHKRHAEARFTRNDALDMLERLARKAEKAGEHNTARLCVNTLADIEGWPAPKRTELDVRQPFSPRIRRLGTVPEVLEHPATESLPELPEAQLDASTSTEGTA